jgi:hypothetical protein
VPKNAKALAWKGPGGMIFAMSSKGMKPRPFFKPAVEASVNYINEQFVKVIEKITSELAGRA